MGEVETCAITVERAFSDFEDFWSSSLPGSSFGETIAAMDPDDAAALKARVRARMPTDFGGRIAHSACANAVRGRV